MILYIEDLLKEINIKNWYLGEARKTLTLMLCSCRVMRMRRMRCYIM